MLDGGVSSKKFKHNPDVIKKLFKNVKDSVVASDDFYILFPERYINKKLAVMGASVKLIAIYAVVDKNMNYGTVIAPVFMDIVPSNVKSVLVDGVINKVIEISKGDVFLPNRNLLRSESFMYDLFDEFFLQGKVPWYIDYDKLSNLFAESKHYAGSNIGNDTLAMEVITSMLARSKDDKTISYRESLTNKRSKSIPEYIGLNNIYFSYDNTLSKIMGGYMQQGVTTAIVNKEEDSTRVSELLRA